MLAWLTTILVGGFLRSWLSLLAAKAQQPLHPHRSGSLPCTDMTTPVIHYRHPWVHWATTIQDRDKDERDDGFLPDGDQ